MNSNSTARPPILAFVWSDEAVEGLEEMFSSSRRKRAPRTQVSAFINARPPSRRSPAGSR